MESIVQIFDSSSAVDIYMTTNQLFSCSNSNPLLSLIEIVSQLLDNVTVVRVNARQETNRIVRLIPDKRVIIFDFFLVFWKFSKNAFRSCSMNVAKHINAGRFNAFRASFPNDAKRCCKNVVSQGSF